MHLCAKVSIHQENGLKILKGKGHTAFSTMGNIKNKVFEWKQFLNISHNAKLYFHLERLKEDEKWIESSNFFFSDRTSQTSFHEEEKKILFFPLF